MKFNVSWADSFKKCGSVTDWRMADLEMLYNTNYLNYEGGQTQQIPKILHYVWLGSPVPPKLKELTAIWAENHPKWEIKLWDEKTVDAFRLENDNLYRKIPNWSAKSDIIRSEVLHRFGGIYTDTDVLSIKSMDDLLYLKFFGGYGAAYNEVTGPENLFPCVIGSCPQNEMLRNIINKTKAITYIPKTIPEIMECGPDLFWKTILGELDPELTVLFPPSFLYPFPGLHRENIRMIPVNKLWDSVWPWTFPETYTMHLFYCSWQQQALCNS